MSEVRKPQTDVDMTVCATWDWLLMELVRHQTSGASVRRRDHVDAIDNDYIDRRHPASEFKTNLVARRGA